MDNTENDIPHAKASRQQQSKVSHEFCQGYVDKNGIWNNGFFCRRWGGPEETYCCGDGRERFCCPEQTSVTSQTSTPSIGSYVPIIVGASVGLVIVIVGLLLGCFLCRSCPGYKSRRKSKSPRQVIIGRTLSVSMEAEATSAVIAAQALVPLKACSSPGQGSSSEDGHLHCGCRWSPTNSSTTMVDIDSLVTSMYQNTTSAWQPELDNFYNNYSCEIKPSCKESTLRQKGGSRLPPSARINAHRKVVQGRHSPLCIQSIRTNSSAARESSDDSKNTTLERDSHPSSLRRTYGLPDPIRLQGSASRDAGAGAISLIDPERQRRDSGVLIEDQDTTGSANSMLALNIPAIELSSLGRQLEYSTIDRKKKKVPTATLR